MDGGAVIKPTAPNVKKRSWPYVINDKCFVLHVSVVALLSFSVPTYRSSILTMLQRQFGLDGSQVGAIQGISELLTVFAALAIPALFRGTSRPLLIAVCGIIAGFATIMMTIPHFVVGIKVDTTRNLSGRDDDLCVLNRSKGEQILTASPDNIDHTGVIVFFTVSSLLQGLGIPLALTLGIPYLHDLCQDFGKTGIFGGMIKCLLYHISSVHMV